LQAEDKVVGEGVTPKDIQALFKDELLEVEKSLRDNFRSSVAIIPLISEHLAMGGGKRLRPMLVLSTARLCGYKGDGNDIIHSTVVEYIHAATLLHDDVVDEADTRRGLPSANAKWGNEYSVLVGDFLFSKAFGMMAEHSPDGVIPAVAEAITRLAEGEILQLVHNINLKMTEEQYLDLVFRKTGALIKASCQIGGFLGKANSTKMKALAEYGRKVGIAFQIVDDMLDFTSDEETLGKPVGQDLIEGHITLPVIHAYSQASDEEKAFLEESVSDEELAKKRVGDVIKLIEKYDSIAYSRSVAERYAEDALSELEIFEQGKYLYILKGLAEYIVNRDS